VGWPGICNRYKSEGGTQLCEDAFTQLWSLPALTAPLSPQETTAVWSKGISAIADAAAKACGGFGRFAAFTVAGNMDGGIGLVQRK
jgi:hypothetical protein